VVRLLTERDLPIHAQSAAIGVFDGVHLGHRALLAARAGAPLVITFDPHPAKLLAPALAPPLTEPLHQRLKRLEGLGCDACYVHTFDAAFAAMEARDYARTFLLDGFGAPRLAVGHDFRFGRAQQGDIQLLRALGVEVHEVDAVRVDGMIASSTKVREFVRRGLMDGAARLLGRPFALHGQVVAGHGRGRTIGVPTLNLAFENELVPAVGVYATRTLGHAAVTNVGVAPTFQGQALRVETHLLDYAGGDLYGQKVEVEFATRLRDERRFDGADALRAQIALDVAEARRCLA
jgi:riboflavin kinase/FMN adenylyltransferase